MDCSPPGSSVHGVLQARLLEWIVMPSSKGSSQPSDQTRVSYVSWISGGFFTTNATWEALGRFHNVLLSFIVSLISFIQGKTIHGLDEYSVSQTVEHFPVDVLAKISETETWLKLKGVYLGFVRTAAWGTQIQKALELCYAGLQNEGGLKRQKSQVYS